MSAYLSFTENLNTSNKPKNKNKCIKNELQRMPESNLQSIYSVSM